MVISSQFTSGLIDIAGSSITKVHVPNWFKLKARDSVSEHIQLNIIGTEPV